MSLDKTANPTRCKECRKVSDVKEEICDGCGGLEFIPITEKEQLEMDRVDLIKKANILGVAVKETNSIKQIEQMIEKEEKKIQKEKDKSETKENKEEIKAKKKEEEEEKKIQSETENKEAEEDEEKDSSDDENPKLNKNDNSDNSELKNIIKKNLKKLKKKRGLLNKVLNRGK